MNGTGGGSENSEHQKLPGYLQVTCAEIAGKRQEEGFAGGLSARNAPEFRTAACTASAHRLRAWRTASAHGVSRLRMASVGWWLVAVDNLWITCG